MGITDVEHIENFDNGIIGTGPYKIDSFNGVGVGYTLLANEYYREDVPYDKINLMFMGDNFCKDTGASERTGRPGREYHKRRRYPELPGQR